VNIVLYTKDFEPITVIDLPLWALEMGEHRGFVRVAVMEPVPYVAMSQQDLILTSEVKTVTLEFHSMRWLNKQGRFITVDNDVLALKLKPSWLPGQRGRVNEYERTIRDLSTKLIEVLSLGK
jgi:hypothetical protein